MPKEKGTLIIIPCAQQKIWDKTPHLGPASAKDAYTSVPFKLNRQFAERFGDKWFILSARYGFISPSFRIPCNYNVTFKNKASHPISVSQLKIQVRNKKFHEYRKVLVLGGKDYQLAIKEAFNPPIPNIICPFAGLPIGKAMQATKIAIKNGVL